MCTLPPVTAVNFTYHIPAELQPTVVINGTSKLQQAATQLNVLKSKAMYKYLCTTTVL